MIKFNIFVFKMKKEFTGKNPSVQGTLKETNDNVIFLIIMLYNFHSFAHAKTFLIIVRVKIVSKILLS